MKSPFEKMREKRGWTKEKSADLLGNPSWARVIGRIEKGKMRIPDKFYVPLRNLGVDPFELAIDQERFIEWRKNFHSYLRSGIPPLHLLDKKEQAAKSSHAAIESEN
jgi:transcriptional regulator with XRE-family HTH domain